MAQNNNLASIFFLFDGKKNTFLHFLNVFSKSKNKEIDMYHCGQYGKLIS